MTIGREQSDFSQGDLVFRGCLRVPISGRTHHLRHLQERTKLQQRLDIEGKNSTSTYLREVLTQLYALYDPVGPADGTEILQHPRADHPAKAMGFNCFRAFSAGSGGPLDFQGSGLCPNSLESYPVRQTGSPDATRIQNIQKNEFIERYRVLFEPRTLLYPTRLMPEADGLVIPQALSLGLLGTAVCLAQPPGTYSAELLNSFSTPKSLHLPLLTGIRKASVIVNSDINVNPKFIIAAIDSLSGSAAKRG